MSVDIKDLVKARVHFGHRTTKWNPRMAPYIWGHKNNIHLINVAKTAVLLERAAKFLESIAAQGKSILWIGTKKPAQDKIIEIAKQFDSPYVVHRWIGGSLTNFPQVKKSVTKMMHYEDILKKADRDRYTKKELNRFQKIAEKLQQNIGGIRTLKLPVGAVVVVDVNKEQAAIKEAMREKVPVVALIDTNADPTGLDYIVPCNDDAVSSISLIADYLAQAVARGVQKAASEKAKAKEQEIKKQQEVVKAAKDSAKASASAKAPREAKKEAPKPKTTEKAAAKPAPKKEPVKAKAEKKAPSSVKTTADREPKVAEAKKEAPKAKAAAKTTEKATPKKEAAKEVKAKTVAPKKAAPVKVKKPVAKKTSVSAKATADKAAKTKSKK